MQQQTQSRGMSIFLVIWFGQLISLIGSGLTRFALAVWLYERTGSVTDLGLVAFFPEIAILLCAPFAGALIDRWDRRTAMLISDTGAGVCTLVIALLLATNQLQIWQIYLLTTLSAAFATFQEPAYAAATTLLVPKEHYGRASGMVQLGQALSHLIAPALAGILMVSIKLQGIIAIDVATFFFAVLTLLLVRIPRPPVTVEGQQSRSSLLNEATYGWKYIRARPGMLGMLVFLSVINLNLGIAQVTLLPLVMSFSSEDALGIARSVAAVGMLVGSIVLGVWGGPKRRIIGVLSGGVFQAVCLVLIGLQPNIMLITTGLFLFMLGFPIIVGSAEAIWMSKVAPDIQGRVFSTRNMIVTATLPIAYLVSGPLVDRIFAPLLQTRGALADSLGPIVGVGAGRGIGLLFIVMGALALLATLLSMLYPRLRHVETELPDAVLATSENAGSAAANTRGLQPAIETE